MLIIPGTPLLLPGVDPGEPACMGEMREAVREILAESPTWRLPLVGDIPELLSLGAFGIDHGLGVSPGEDGHSEPRVHPSDCIQGADLSAAVDALTDRTAAEAVDTGAVVAAHAAVFAGCAVRLVRADRSGAGAGAEQEPLIAPVNFSAAAHPDAPLAPIPGAEEFDAALESCLTGTIDTADVSRLAQVAPAYAATLGPLAHIDVDGAFGTVIAEFDVHRVRYRIFRVDVGTPAGSAAQHRERVGQ